MAARIPMEHLIVKPTKAKTGDPRSLARRPGDPRHLLGQVFTPPLLAKRMVSVLLKDRPSWRVTILDPSCGPATFPKILASCGLLYPDDTIELYEVDPALAAVSSQWSEKAPCAVKIWNEDYLTSVHPSKFDYAILNPPYVRQEWVDKKDSYRAAFINEYEVDLPGTSNLYVYFLVKVIKEIKSGGRFACVIYDSWQSTRYGNWLLEFLHTECHSIEFLPAGSQPFSGTLIDATIIHGIKRDMPVRNAAALTQKASILISGSGFVPIMNLFHTRRGLRLKQADFFLNDRRKLSIAGATPFIKKARGFDGLRVPHDHPEEALLVSVSQSKPAVRQELDRRFEDAMVAPAENISVITWHRERNETWFAHPKPPYAPFLFNYYLRGRPRHIHNLSRAYSDNFYGLTPRSSGCAQLSEMILAILNSTVVCADILTQARNQGSGLSKVQLFEYRRIYIPDWTSFSGQGQRKLYALGVELATKGLRHDVIAEIDATITSEIRIPEEAFAAMYQNRVALSIQPR